MELSKLKAFADDKFNIISNNKKNVFQGEIAILQSESNLCEFKVDKYINKSIL